jgi:hypothetical protein
MNPEKRWPIEAIVLRLRAMVQEYNDDDDGEHYNQTTTATTTKHHQQDVAAVQV